MKTKSSRIRSLMTRPCASGKIRYYKTGYCRKDKRRSKSSRIRSLVTRPCPSGKSRYYKTGYCRKKKSLSFKKIQKIQKNLSKLDPNTVAYKKALQAAQNNFKNMLELATRG